MTNEPVAPTEISTLADLGYSEAQIAEITRLSTATQGMAVLSGPVNTGMSTAIGVKSE